VAQAATVVVDLVDLAAEDLVAEVREAAGKNHSNRNYFYLSTLV
jgi:hypothetical protein